MSLFMGGETTTSRAVVQSAGHAYQLTCRRLKMELMLGGAMQHLLLRYTQALLTHMAQTAVCNRHHSLTTTLSMVAAEPRPVVRNRVRDPGIERQQAGRAS